MDATRESIAAMQDAPANEGVGMMLRRRRIELGLSLADVASVVKLPPRRIESLEHERWQDLPDGPYLRGFLKNIARALDIDAAVLVDRVDDSLMRSRNPDSILVAPGAPHATLPRRSGPADDRRSGRHLVLGACVFAVIAALIAWSGTSSFNDALRVGKSLVAAQRGAPEAAPPATNMTSEPVAKPLVPTPGETPPANEVAVAATPAPIEAVAGAKTPVLRFQFTEDAWVEVRSSDGRVLLKQLNPAGTEQLVAGDAPFSLIVGNARAVELRFRGQHVDLTPYTRDQVARLTLS